MSSSGFVGAGLVFAGVTGFCGMARMLGLMPWNRARASGLPSPSGTAPLSDARRRKR